MFGVALKFTFIFRDNWSTIEKKFSKERKKKKRNLAWPAVDLERHSLYVIRHSMSVEIWSKRFLTSGFGQSIIQRVILKFHSSLVWGSVDWYFFFEDLQNLLLFAYKFFKNVYVRKLTYISIYNFSLIMIDLVWRAIVIFSARGQIKGVW